jgi:hypothetical protein
MEKRDYCFDYIRDKCENLKCQYSHVIVENKEEFLKKHEDRIRVRLEVKEYNPSFVEVKTNTVTSDKKKISKCVLCQKGFLVSERLIEIGDPSSIKCEACLKK